MNKLQLLTNNANFGNSNLPSAALGDINILIGINGGGKTTLLQSLRNQIIDNREHNATDGNIYWYGDEYIEDELALINGNWLDIIEDKGELLDEATKLIKSIYPSVVGMVINPDDDALYVEFENNWTYFEEMGAGFIALMRIIVGVQIAKNGYLIIDNLGNGLHLDSTSKVCKFIMDAITWSDMQVFISTHCPSCLSSLKSRNSEIDIDTTLINVKSAYQLPNHVIDACVLEF